MIRIMRPMPIPAVLTGRGASQTREDEAAYERQPRQYRDGRATFDINPKIYGHKSVKSLLLQAQSGKCCYCERKILPTDFGDVEHFRPKSGVRSSSSDRPVRPGYYWLAYNWSNLLVSCAVCNTAWKMSYFPVRDERRRARWHGDVIAHEPAMLVDPVQDDPREHIRYDGDAPYALTQRGQTTIETLGLRRGDLREARKDHLDTLILLRATAIRLGSTDPVGAAAEDRLRSLAEPSREFSSMVTDFLAAPFTPPVQPVILVS